MESILTSIKKLLGIAEEHTHFDKDIIVYINTVFVSLSQIGVGPPEGFRIDDDLAVWDDFVTGSLAELVKTYTYMKVRMMFDPPSSSIMSDAIKSNISELEWRIFSIVDFK